MTYRDEKQALKDRIAALEQKREELTSDLPRQKAKLSATEREEHAIALELKEAHKSLDEMEEKVDSAHVEKAIKQDTPSILSTRNILIFFLIILSVITIFSLIFNQTSSRAGKWDHQHVPEGLKGLKFGMTLEQAKAVLPHIKPMPNNDQCRIKGKYDFDNWNKERKCKSKIKEWQKLDDQFISVVPRKAVEVLLFGEPARCVLSFSIDRSLSRMSCRIDLPFGKEHITWDKIIRDMNKKWNSGYAISHLPKKYELKNQKAVLKAELNGSDALDDYTSNYLISRGLSSPRERGYTVITNVLRSHIAGRKRIEWEVSERRERQREEIKRREVDAQRLEDEKKRREKIEELKRLESKRKNEVE